MFACAALLTVFAALALLSSRSKSPTYDEPLHALGAWLHLWKHDFRVDPEDPPLWKYWAALPNPPSALKVDLQSARYADVAADVYNEWPFVVQTLYRTEGNNADAVTEVPMTSATSAIRPRRLSTSDDPDSIPLFVPQVV